MTKQHSAFTLVELSIVLVILGLLIGGVLTGQSLIRAAELRAVTTQEQRYVTATQTFRDKYFALPGDMANAASYWGAADGAGGTTAACKTTIGTGTTTCNGNNDGLINTGPISSNEWFRFWQHLANSGLIEGNYTGVAGPTLYGGTTVNSPPGRASSTYWWSISRSPLIGNSQLFDGQYDNTFETGVFNTNGEPLSGFLKPEEAYNIDTKLDDGRPATGKVVAAVNGFTNSPTSCTDATATSAITSNYLLTNTGIACAIVFRQAF